MAIDSQTLQNLAMFGLGDDITKMNPQQLEDALYGRSEADINRRSGLDAQAALENTFARGVGQQGGGPSTITASAIEPIERGRGDALAKARMDAFTASQSARLAALGQAAAVSQNALNSGASAGAQQQAMALQRRGQDIQGNAATNQMIGQGVGGLGGAALTTAGLLYPNKLRSLLGADAGKPDGGLNKLAGNPALGPGDTLGPPSPSAGAAGLAGFGGGGGGPSATAPSFGGGSFSPVSFEMPSYEGFGSGGGLGDLASWNFDTSGMEDWLSNTPKNFDWGSYL